MGISKETSNKGHQYYLFRDSDSIRNFQNLTKKGGPIGSRYNSIHCATNLQYLHPITEIVYWYLSIKLVSGKAKTPHIIVMQAIKDLYVKKYNISENDWNFFASKLVREQWPKKKPILQQGEIEGFISFVESGIVRQFIPHQNKEITFGFVFPNGFISAYDSFLNQSPSDYSIEPVIDCVLWRISFDDLQVVYDKTGIGNLIGRKTAENLFRKKAKRELSFLTETPIERYQNLFDERPELIREIPLKYVASYIGVTPEALSRIRNRIT